MALPLSVCRVGVFVDATFDAIMQVARTALLHAVQLHGMESPALVKKIGDQGLTVIKTLFSHREPFFTQAAHFQAAAFLVECGVGRYARHCSSDDLASQIDAVLADSSFREAVKSRGPLLIREINDPVKSAGEYDKTFRELLDVNEEGRSE